MVKALGSPPQQAFCPVHLKASLKALELDMVLPQLLLLSTLAAIYIWLTRTQALWKNEYLAKEKAEGRILGPVSFFYPIASDSSWLHSSPFSVIPKKQPGKGWLIVDLSSPKNHSINDGIDPACCSLHYSGLDEAVAIVTRLGRGARLAKLDLKSVYRVVPVHAEDCHLLALKSHNEFYIDAALPFGFRSAPKVFSAFANTLLSIMASCGIKNGIHSLDDFLFAGAADS